MSCHCYLTPLTDPINPLTLGQAGLAQQFTIAGETLANWIRDYNLSSANTTIVGHSLGGALAQYFGANFTNERKVA